MSTGKHPRSVRRWDTDLEEYWRCAVDSGRALVLRRYSPRQIRELDGGATAVAVRRRVARLDVAGVADRAGWSRVQSRQPDGWAILARSVHQSPPAVIGVTGTGTVYAAPISPRTIRLLQGVLTTGALRAARSELRSSGWRLPRASAVEVAPC